MAGHSIELGGGDNDAVGFSLQARQPLFTGYKITSGIARAELAVHTSRESYRKTFRSERFRIVQAFWDLVETAELMRVMEKSVERAKVKHLQSVHSRELAELRTISGQWLPSISLQIKQDVLNLGQGER